MVGTATEVSERAGRELRHLGWHGRAGPGRHEEKWVARESATVVPLSTSKRSLALVTKPGESGAKSVKIGAVASKRVQNPVRGLPFPIQPSSGAGFGPRNTGGMHAVLGLVRGTRVGCMQALLSLLGGVAHLARLNILGSL